MGRWYKDPFVLAGGAALGLALFLERGPVSSVVDTVKDVFTKGKQLTFSTLDQELGIVREDPDELRQLASVAIGVDLPLDTYSLARMIRSEGAAAGNLRAHVALNDLAHLGWQSLHYLLTYSKDPKRKGYYGEQWSAAVPPEYPDANRRRYATTKDPFEGDVRTAMNAIVEHGRGYDPSGGAVKFIDRSSMGVQQGSRSFESVDAAWRADGLVAYTLPTYGEDLVLYRRA